MHCLGSIYTKGCTARFNLHVLQHPNKTTMKTDDSLVHDTKKVWVAVPVARPTVLGSRIAHRSLNEQRRSPHTYV